MGRVSPPRATEWMFPTARPSPGVPSQRLLANGRAAPPPREGVSPSPPGSARSRGRGSPAREWPLPPPRLFVLARAARHVTGREPGPARPLPGSGSPPYLWFRGGKSVVPSLWSRWHRGADGRLADYVHFSLITSRAGKRLPG